MIEQKFNAGDRVKITFEATVSYSTLGNIDYITFSNGQELEFPTKLLPDDVLIEKIEKSSENGWYHVGAEKYPYDIARYYSNGHWYVSPNHAGNPGASVDSEVTHVIRRLEPVE